MEIKKNSRVDLNRNSALYFVIGLCLMLFVSWRLIELKTYEKDKFDYESIGTLKFPKKWGYKGVYL
jgi:protein TonB